VQRAARIGLVLIEITTLSTLILAARCANYRDVFVAGNVYFTDADCYARMTRVRMCEKKPGLIVRHHDFENFPQGTTPHTTAPLDYLILALSILLKPFTAHAADLAGALISPLVALLGGWFLWWWSRRMKFRYRWAMLVLYAISPILVQGTELGRPDHQSLAMLLVTLAICAEWTLRDTEAASATSHAIRDSHIAWRLRTWSAVSGATWALAIWVSAYEPLFLFLLVIVLSRVTGIVAGPPQDRHLLKHRRIGWILFALIIAIALLIERRIPSLRIFQSHEIFKNWARTVGELAHVSPLNSIWFAWAGYMIVVAPLLVWIAVRKRRNGAPGGRAPPVFVLALLAATYCLTIWQARWAYFFMSIFVIALPFLLEPIKSRTAVWVAFILSIFPILRDWDEKLWPNEAAYVRRIEQRNESVQLRDLALNLQSSEVRPFLAPWWLSPSIAYWSAQPAVAGSSHESLPGIEESARFFLARDWRTARKILEDRRVAWVIAYDFERVAQNSAAILGLALPQHPLCFVLDRTPAQAPRFLVFSAQNESGKLYRSVER
jgi:MFS family permease